jgi:hypothetical protein
MKGARLTGPRKNPEAVRGELGLSSWLAELLDAVSVWIEGAAWLERPYVVTAILVGIAILIACPDYRHFRPYADRPWAAEALAWQSAHPLSPIPVAEFALRAGPTDGGIVEHLRKRSYRITVPLISKLSGLGLRYMVGLQQITSCLYLLIGFLLLDRIFGDRVAAFLGSLAISASFFGQWGFNDFDYFDGLAYFSMLLCLWIKRALPIPFLMVGAGFIDERAILAAPLIYLFQGSCTSGSFQEILLPNRLRIGTIAGALIYLSLRIVLGLHYGSIGDRSGISTMAATYNSIVLPLAMLLLFKGIIILAGASIAVLAKLKAYRYALVFGLCVVPNILAGVWVYDLSRSLAYGFPCIFICAGIAEQNLEKVSLRRIMVCTAISSMLMPTYYILLGLHPMLPAFRLWHLARG